MWWIFWFILVGIFVGAEIYALWSGETWMPTFSRTVWWITDRLIEWLGKKINDNSKAERIVRITLALVLTALFGWLIIHFAVGECAFGWC